MKHLVPRLRKSRAIDVVVANGENSAGGSGITASTASEIFGSGVDVITTGDHVWDQRETASFIETEPRLLRPLNYPAGTPGRGSILAPVTGHPPLGVVSLQGRTFMTALEHPFHAVEEEIKKLREYTPAILVDIHAEATSEKIALGRYLDGKVSVVIGTHTHVQTSDEQIFPFGTGFLCDAGFTGPHDSVLGRRVEPVIQRFLTGMPQRFEVASGRVLLQGALVDVDDTTGHAVAITRVSEPLPENA